MPPSGYKKFKQHDFHAPTGYDLFFGDEPKVIVGRSVADELKPWKTLSEVIGRRLLSRSDRRQNKQR
jgi:hypothetical protein